MFSSPQTMLYGEQPGYISGVAIALHKKMKFSIKDFFSKRDQICSFLRIWSLLLMKSLMENFIFCALLVLTHDDDLVLAIKLDLFL